MELCLGTVQFGLNYGICSVGKPDREECYRILDYALKNNIKVFDTASSYGNSEEILGDFFEGIDRKNFKISTKVARNANCEEEIEKSLKRLGVKYIDFYLFHNGEMLSDAKAVEDMYRLKEKGYIMHTGVSVYTPEEAVDAVKNPLIDCVQVPYNVIDRRLDKCNFFDYVEKYHKIIFCRSIFLQGLLRMAPQDAESKLSGSGEIINKYRQLCNKYKISPLNFAGGYIKRKKNINYCVFGVDNLSQLKEGLKLNKTVLPDVAAEEADKLFENVDKKILDPRQW